MTQASDDRETTTVDAAARYQRFYGHEDQPDDEPSQEDLALIAQDRQRQRRMQEAE